jgi:hypothetical protein
MTKNYQKNTYIIYFSVTSSLPLGFIYLGVSHGIQGRKMSCHQNPDPGYYQFYVFDKLKLNKTVKLVCRLWFSACKCRWFSMWMKLLRVETWIWRKKHLLSSLSSFVLRKILPIVRPDRATAMFVARACIWKGVLSGCIFTTLHIIKILVMHRAAVQVVLPRSAVVLYGRLTSSSVLFALLWLVHFPFTRRTNWCTGWNIKPVERGSLVFHKKEAVFVWNCVGKQRKI